MAWRRTGRTRTLKATRELAREWCTAGERDNTSLARLTRERRFNPNRAQQHKVAVDREQFHTPTWVQAYCVTERRWYRLNGQHTSYLLANLVSLAQLAKIKVDIKTYECDTIQDVVDLYRTFDKKNSSRTPGDEYFAAATTIPELAALEDLNAVLLTKLVAGLVWAEKPDTPSANSVDDRVIMMRERRSDLAWVLGVLYGGVRGLAGSESFQRAPVIGVMIASYRAAPDDATEFWEAVREGRSVPLYKPVGALERYLSHTSIGSNAGGQQTDKELASQREMYAKCVYAWNMWRKNKNYRSKSSCMALTYNRKADLPKVI